MDYFELTRQLIDIPSISGDEAAVGNFLANYLEKLNYRVERQEIAGGRANIIATTDAEPRVLLSTHIDTVPPHISSSEDDDYIYGRGACDTKGIIAAQITAAENLRAAGMKEIGLLFTVEEETSGAGARLANTHRIAAECRYLINGEPTQNKLATGSKGSLRFRLATAGRAAHSAYPEQGESAIEKLLDVLADVRAVRWPNDVFFGETTCNIGVINGGAASNIIPAHAEADLHIRLVNDSAIIKEILERTIAKRAHIEYLSIAEPVRLFTIGNFAQGLMRFTTDIPHLTRWGTPLLLGPGSILDAHTAGERIGKHEITEAVSLYERLVQTLLQRIENENARTPHANDKQRTVASEDFSS